LGHQQAPVRQFGERGGNRESGAQFSVRVMPAGASRVPPKRTSTLLQSDWLPALSAARTRSTCYPAACKLVSTLVP